MDPLVSKCFSRSGGVRLFSAPILESRENQQSGHWHVPVLGGLGRQNECSQVKQLIRATVTPRVQVPNNHILSQSPNLHNYYPKTEYLIIGSFGPLGSGSRVLDFRGRVWLLLGQGEGAWAQKP